uniref:Uncharacterized protein n=1 Tax=viral metagenome TaxID=1070528 RepID=A0A6C0AY06_9ZZZZ|tara:strand:- start:6023 stop:6661 length:639 start_codon:yes stop_codon:yes gene_type:complete
MSTNTNDKYLQNKRTIFVMDKKDLKNSSAMIGLLIYLFIFGIIIPYLLYKNKRWIILTGYMPNLDLIATVLGYHGGPFDSFIWNHLYNPADDTLEGYISSNIINYFSLLGVTYIIAYYTYKTGNILKGWSRSIIMLPVTYFLPSNFIIYYMNKFGEYLDKNYKYLENKSLLHYLLVTSYGFLITSVIITGEVYLIEKLTPYINELIKIFFKS